MEFEFRTSGTTGDPKKVIVSDSAIEARIGLYQKHLPLDIGERVLRIIPGEGRNNFSRVASVMYPERVGANVVTITDERITQNQTYDEFDVVFAYFPEFKRSLQSLRPTEKGPRLFVFGGYPFNEQDRKAVTQIFRRTTVVSNYGSSEVGVMALTDGGPIRPFCVGKPIVPTKVENDEVLFSGDTLAEGYSNGTKIGGWFAQGDRAALKGGELYIYGRKS